MNEQEARKHVKKLKEFYSHALSFVLVNMMLIALNLMTSPESLWFIWPLFGWGIGLASHAFSVFGFSHVANREWEERKVQELMQHEEGVTRAEVERLLSEARVQDRLPKGDDAAAERARLIRRIEHLEAIVTSRDWDQLDRDQLDAREAADEHNASDAPSTSAEKVARLARRMQ